VELLDALVAWLQHDWTFSAIFFMSNSQLTSDAQMLRSAGFAEPSTMRAQSDGFDWQFWQLSERV